MAFLMSPECGTQDGFCQPAIEETELSFVVHVLEVVVQDCDIANTLFNYFTGYFNKVLNAALGIRLLLPTPVTAKGKAKQILDFAQLVTGKRHLAARSKEQTKMAKFSGWWKIRAV